MNIWKCGLFVAVGGMMPYPAVASTIDDFIAELMKSQGSYNDKGDIDDLVIFSTKERLYLFDGLCSLVLDYSSPELCGEAEITTGRLPLYKWCDDPQASDPIYKTNVDVWVGNVRKGSVEGVDCTCLNESYKPPLCSAGGN